MCRNNSRRNFIKTLGSGVITILTSPLFATSAKTNQPNIILMMADDLGIGDVNCYGFNDRIKTPELDKMAESGLKFNRFYSQAPVCSPTRGSCLTGRHPFRYGIFEANTGHLRYEEVTLAEILKDNGYICGHFGKWHLGTLGTMPGHKAVKRMLPSDPLKNGFDYHFSTESSVQTWDPYGPAGNSSVTKDLFVENGKVYKGKIQGDSSRIIVDKAIPFIKNATNEDKPFFAVIWFYTPHNPVKAGPEFKKIYSELSIKEQNYYGAITAMDEQIGRIRNELRNLGIEKNTMLWFTSDNGPTGAGSAGHFKGKKRHLFEGGIRVPGILEWPKIINKKRTTEMIACTSDYFRTSLEAVGIKAKTPQPNDGISLMPLINDKMKERPGYICFQSHGSSVVMSQKLKAIKVRPKSFSEGLAKKNNFPLDQWLLFDMVEDEKETINIAPNNKNILNEMTIVYNNWANTCEDSFQGKNYNLPDYEPTSKYRKNGGIKSRKKNKQPNKTKK